VPTRDSALALRFLGAVVCAALAVFAWWFFDFARRMAGAGAGANRTDAEDGMLIFWQFAATAVPAIASIALFVSYGRLFRRGE